MTKQKQNAETLQAANAQQLENAGRYKVTHSPAPVVRDTNLTLTEQKEAIRAGMDTIASALRLDVLVPDADGTVEVEFASEDQNGEVEIVRCRETNRHSGLQRGVLGQIVRQFDWSVGRAQGDIAAIKREISSMLNRMDRSEDPAKIRDAIEAKLRWADVLADRAAFAQAMADAAHDAYFDLIGSAYAPTEAKAQQPSRPVRDAVPIDPVLAAARAFAK